MDAEIVEKLQAGDAETFAWLVEQYKNKVLNTCYRFLYDREDAEDVCQEVFIEVYRSVGSFRAEAKLSTWIYRIAVTKSLDFIRKKNRQKRVSQIKDFFGGEGRSAETRTPDPFRKLEQKERLRIIQGAINRLPKQQGIAFTLSKCEEFGNREIADVMDLTLSAVDALLHRAKSNLQKQLTSYFTEESGKR